MIRKAISLSWGIAKVLLLLFALSPLAILVVPSYLWLLPADTPLWFTQLASAVICLWVLWAGHLLMKIVFGADGFLDIDMPRPRPEPVEEWWLVPDEEEEDKEPVVKRIVRFLRDLLFSLMLSCIAAVACAVQGATFCIILHKILGVKGLPFGWILLAMSVLMLSVAVRLARRGTSWLVFLVWLAMCFGTFVGFVFIETPIDL